MLDFHLQRRLRLITVAVTTAIVLCVAVAVAVVIGACWVGMARAASPDRPTEEWALVVYDANHDLVAASGGFPSEQACRFAGIEAVRGRPYWTFRCAPNRTYRPKGSL